MRKCPKCGERYADDDFRTICSNCLVELVPDISTAAPAPAEDAGPVSVGPQAVAAPEYASLLTGTPAVLSYPEIAPLPAEMPGLPSSFPPLEPEPEPGPMPSPSHTPEPYPAPAPAPPETHPTPPGALPGRPRGNAGPKLRRLKPEELAGSKMSAFLLICLAAAIGITGMLALHDWSSVDVYTLLIWGAMLVGIVLCLRQALLLRTVPRVTVTPCEKPRLGAALPVQITLDIARMVRIETFTLTLTEREQIAATEGRGGQPRLTDTRYTRTIQIPVRESVPAEHQLSLTAELPIPDEGVPSFATQHYQILWSIELRVEMSGWISTIRRKVWLTVPPVRAQTPLPATRLQWLELPQLYMLNAHLLLDCILGVRSLPELYVGQAVPFTLAICPKTASGTQKCWVELGYAISGGEITENVMVSRTGCFLRGWKEGERGEESGVLHIPATAPVSFTGKLLHVAWQLSVVHEFPGMPAQRVNFEVTVLPAGER